MNFITPNSYGEAVKRLFEYSRLIGKQQLRRILESVIVKSLTLGPFAFGNIDKFTIVVGYLLVPPSIGAPSIGAPSIDAPSIDAPSIGDAYPLRCNR